MAGESDFFPSGDRSPLPAAVVGVIVHGLLWSVLFTGVATAISGQHQTFSELGVQLPHATRWVFHLGRLVAAEPILAGLILVGILGLDFFLLYRLGRGHRVLRELWSGVMVAIPVVAFAVAGSAIALIHQKLSEAFLRPVVAASKSERAELGRLSGRWRLIAIERDGAAGAVPKIELSISERSFTWDGDGGTRTGSVQPLVNRNPLGISLWQMTGPEPGTIRHGLYRFDGPNLVLCLAPPEVLGEALPTGFTTQGTKNELLTFSKAE